MNFTRYEIATGRLISNIMTTGDVQDRLAEGEGAIEGWHDPSRFRVENGQLVEIEPQNSFDEAENEARLRRDLMLQQSDWTQLPDAPADKAAWATYRQALRDLPNHVKWPNLSDSDWPMVPEV